MMNLEKFLLEHYRYGMLTIDFGQISFFRTMLMMINNIHTKETIIGIENKI